MVSVSEQAVSIVTHQQNSFSASTLLRGFRKTLWLNGAARLVEIGSMVKIQCQHLFLTHNDDQRFAIMTD